jgi:hypothetical protein
MTCTSETSLCEWCGVFYACKLQGETHSLNLEINNEIFHTLCQDSFESFFPVESQK